MNTPLSVLLLALFWGGGFIFGAGINQSATEDPSALALLTGFSNISCISVNDSMLSYPNVLVNFKQLNTTPTMYVGCRNNILSFVHNGTQRVQ